jgi:hypothetical protein
MAWFKRKEKETTATEDKKKRCCQEGFGTNL